MRKNRERIHVKIDLFVLHVLNVAAVVLILVALVAVFPVVLAYGPSDVTLMFPVSPMVIVNYVIDYPDYGDDDDDDVYHVVHSVNTKNEMIILILFPNVFQPCAIQSYNQICQIHLIDNALSKFYFIELKFSKMEVELILLWYEIVIYMYTPFPLTI